MPRIKISKNEDDFKEVVRRTGIGLSEIRGELIGLFRQLGRLFARAPVRDYARSFIDDAMAQRKTITKRARATVGRYHKSTGEFRKQSRKRAVRDADVSLHLLVHAIEALANGISSFAESWAEEVNDEDLIREIQETLAAEEPLEGGPEHYIG